MRRVLFIAAAILFFPCIVAGFVWAYAWGAFVFGAQLAAKWSKR